MTVTGGVIEYTNLDRECMYSTEEAAIDILVILSTDYATCMSLCVTMSLGSSLRTLRSARSLLSCGSSGAPGMATYFAFECFGAPIRGGVR